MNLIILEIYAGGCVLYLMPLMAVNRCWNGAILSTEVMLFAIFLAGCFLGYFAMAWSLFGSRLC